MYRYDILNSLIQRYKLKTYLEIGLDNAENFKKVQCESKESCDPYIENKETGLEQKGVVDNYGNLRADIFPLLTYRMTSDAMFKQNKKKYDLIFIDGLHERHQVLRDIKNALEHLNENGFIVMHDCLPKREECQLVPRVCGEWNGDVWKVLPYLKKCGIDFQVIDTDYGCGIIKYQNIEIPIREFDFEYKDYFNEDTIRNQALNVISKEQFLEQIK